MKKLNLFIGIILSFALLLTGCKIETAKQHNQKNDNSNKEKINVSLEIKCDTILDNMDKADNDIKKIIPKDGIILKEKQFEIPVKSSAYDLLIVASKENSYTVTSTGSNKNAYITSIADIKEFCVGALSGWKYKVNGEFASVSCGSYELKPDDKVEFLYTCDLGEDLK